MIFTFANFYEEPLMSLLLFNTIIRYNTTWTVRPGNKISVEASCSTFCICFKPLPTLIHVIWNYDLTLRHCSAHAVAISPRGRSRFADADKSSEEVIWRCVSASAHAVKILHVEYYALLLQIKHFYRGSFGQTIVPIKPNSSPWWGRYKPRAICAPTLWRDWGNVCRRPFAFQSWPCYL